LFDALQSLLGDIFTLQNARRYFQMRVSPACDAAFDFASRELDGTRLIAG